MIPRRVRIALVIAFLCHGLFILTARYRLSYDAYTHMLFANHYAEDWFSLWETRWYTGFTVTSYPPLTHQLIALFSFILGLDKAYAFVLWTVTSLYPLGGYAFSRIFTGRNTASYGALVSAISLPIYVTAHIFGQLPFLTSTLIALFGAASLDRYLREGGLHNLLLAVSLITTSNAAHHATLMVHPFLILAVVLNVIYRHNAREIERSVRLYQLLKRMLLFGSLSILTSIIVVWPFWDWGPGQAIQTPIDHLSRHNFLTDPDASALFFWPLYGPLVAVIPFLFRKWPPRYIGLIISFTILCLLGLGGTTPLPRLIFGDTWEWLTYDRFAFWASLALTPFFGMLFIRLKWGWKIRFMNKLVTASLRRRFLATLIFFVFAATALGVWFTPFFLPIQPEPIDMELIVTFLNKGDRSAYRYLTFGFGDQFAHLNILTKATTIDGSYHSARTLPELRKSGIGQIDTVYWAMKGVPAIGPILRKSGDYGVRWGFVNPKILEPVKLRWGVIHRNLYAPVLEQLGWMKFTTLNNGVLVYENPNAVLPEPSTPPETKPITSFSWGVFPILALVSASALGTLRLWPVGAEKAIRGIYAFLAGLIPLSLCFWYYRIIGEFPHERVYFTYDNALFFLSDAFVLLVLVLWLSVKISRWPENEAHQNSTASRNLLSFISHPSSFKFFLLALLLLASISIFWSTDWRTSLAISTHLWFVYLFILSLRDWNFARKPVMYGLCAALCIQLIAGLTGFALQSTAFLEPLEMNWPGVLDPSIRGASVVQLSNGLRILRAYGTLPHPNILGGFAFISLLGPASLFLAGEKKNYLVLILLCLGILLIGITFSRSAWLAFLGFLLLLLFKSKHLNRKKLLLLLSAGLMTTVLTIYPFRDLMRTRVSNAPVQTEQLSTFGRSWLNQQAMDMIRQHPLTGVGLGSFVIELGRHAIEGALIEPVHSIPLLTGAELGVPGLILIAGLFLSIGLQIIKAQTPQSILASATITGLGIISLFDHYLWTVAPGRLMLGLALGLWAGGVNQNGA